MNIWAHRGCSQCYPENTIISFEKAMEIPGLTGIELDIQLTKNGELVVIHDERVDRTTDGIGFVRDYTLKELKSLHIHTGKEEPEHIPTMREVLDLLEPSLKAYISDDNTGIRLNIELKTGVYPYPGIEQKITDLVHEYGVERAIVYSSFYAESLVRMHSIDPDVTMGVLDSRVSDCLYKTTGIETLLGDKLKVPLALHPNGNCMDIDKERFADRTVRAWFGGHLYPEKPTGGRMDLDKLASAGVTDVFINEPEKYI